MEHLRCVVERITYQNAENGYTVLRCAAKGSKDLITVVGLMPDVHVGSVLALDGFWKMDAKYGRQFSAERMEETLPATVYGIEKYLGSGLVKGVGPKFAKRVVQKFGKDTLDVIETNPDALSQVEGIGRVRVERIKKSWQEQKEIKNIMLFLQSHEVSTAHATKIFKTYGSDSINIVKDNPYRLADDIWGIGFKTADAIAEKLGIGKARFIRLRSGILYTLNKLAESGHCYALWEQLIAKAEGAPGGRRTGTGYDTRRDDAQPGCYPRGRSHPSAAILLFRVRMCEAPSASVGDGEKKNAEPGTTTESDRKDFRDDI